MQQTIQCVVCGQSFRSITWRHLQSHNLTLTRYRELYPESPIHSEAAMNASSEGSKKANAHRKGVPRPQNVKDKISKKNKGKSAWNKGICKTEEEKRHLSQIKREKYASGTIVHWNVGNVTPESVKEKISKTALSQNRIYSEQSKIKRKKTMEQKLDDGWVHPSHRPNCLQKRSETMFERYGVDNFMQRHLKPSVLSKLNDRDWLYDQHVTQNKPITQICVDLGLHWKNNNKLVKSRLDKFDIPQQYNHSSSFPEREIRGLLDQWGVSYIANDRNTIKPKELDILIPSVGVAIEYCGLLWHSSAFIKNPNYHKNKHDLCKKQNIRLITIFEDEWLHSRDIVESKLKYLLVGADSSKRVYARNCTVKPLDNTQAAVFLNAHHIQGSGPGGVRLGLFHENDLVAVAIYRQQGTDYILNRYATSIHVVGGFTKIERYFDRVCKPTRVITFADMRWSDGKLYESAGYDLVGVLPPDYSYVDTSNFTRIHKFNFRHKHLHRRLQHYDPSLSETQNCYNNGWYKIYNCGLLKYIRTIDSSMAL